MELQDSRWTTKRNALVFLDDLQRSGADVRTIYLPPATAQSWDSDRYLPEDEPYRSTAANIINTLPRSETGLAIYLLPERAFAILPPFPMRTDESFEGTTVDPLRRLLTDDITVGVVMLRLGRYAVGVLRGDSLITSKTDTRYVKHRHRAGGQSQRRFERSRERLVRELYDKACQVTRNVFSAHQHHIDYVLLGGERHTLAGFRKRCPYLTDLAPRILSRLLQVGQPNQKALDAIATEVWKSQVVTFK